MENQKVTVPIHVAAALEKYNNKDNKGEVYLNIKSIGYESEDTATILGYLDDNSLLSALINGYEIAKTPEDKLRYYYRSLDMRSREADEAYGINTALDILGIKIEGINA